jgi:hypothetical protein
MFFPSLQQRRFVAGPYPAHLLHMVSLSIISEKSNDTKTKQKARPDESSGRAEIFSQTVVPPVLEIKRSKGRPPAYQARMYVEREG